MGRNEAELLYYAIIGLFANGREITSEDTLSKLKPVYCGRKLFTRKGIDEALAAARENGLLGEASYKTSASGNLAVIYTITGFRKETVSKYL